MIVVSHAPANRRPQEGRLVQLRAVLGAAPGVSLPTTDATGRVTAPGEARLSMQAAGAPVAPSRDDLALINERHSGVELSEDDVVVFQDYALHNQRLARRSLQFTRGALSKLAEKAREGRSVIRDHNWECSIGAVFNADVVEETVRGVEAAWLRLRWYAVLTDDTSRKRRSLVQDCRTGVLRFGSVSVVGGAWEFQEVEGDDGWDYWYLIDDADSLDLFEYSRTVMGAAQGAGDHKFGAGSADAGPTPASPTTPQPNRPRAAYDLCVL